MAAPAAPTAATQSLLTPPLPLPPPSPPKACVVADFLSESSDLVAGGQFAVQEEIGRLKEGGFFCKLLDGIPSVTQNPLFSIDEGDLALAGSGVAITSVEGDAFAGSTEGSQIDGSFILGSLYKRKSVVFRTDAECGCFFHLAGRGSMGERRNYFNLWLKTSMGL